MKRDSTHNSPVIFLWAVPRSVSTAFEKAMSQHPKIKTVHDSLTGSYYFSKARRSDRYGLPKKIQPPLILNLRSIKQFISSKCITFIKELTFQGNHYISDACLKASRHLIILRKPNTVYRSLIKIKPDFTECEFGFTALKCLMDRLNRLNSPPLAIYDGDNFRDSPKVVLRETCNLIGVEFYPTMLFWKSGKIRDWSASEALSQAQWHKTLDRSTTILPSDSNNTPIAVPPRHRAIVNLAETIYKKCIR